MQHCWCNCEYSEEMHIIFHRHVLHRKNENGGRGGGIVWYFDDVVDLK